MPIEIDCDFLNTLHAISHATLSRCWVEWRSTKNDSALLPTTPVLLCTTKYYSSSFKGICCKIRLFQLPLLYISKSQQNGMQTLSIFACAGSRYSSKMLSHKKNSSINVPTAILTSIPNQPCFVTSVSCQIIIAHQHNIISSLSCAIPVPIATVAGRAGRFLFFRVNVLQES